MPQDLKLPTWMSHNDEPLVCLLECVDGCHLIDVMVHWTRTQFDCTKDMWCVVVQVCMTHTPLYESLAAAISSGNFTTSEQQYAAAEQDHAIADRAQSRLISCISGW